MSWVLVNMVLGFNIMAKKGEVLTQETKDRIRISINKKKLSGWNNSRLGYQHTEESKKRNSLAHKQLYSLGYIAPAKGRKHTKEEKQKMRGRHWSTESKMRFIPNMGRGIHGYRPDIGLYVRSTWEANFVRVLKFLSIKYQYEPKKFQIGNITTYTPDFYIPSLDLWIEIKGWDNMLSHMKRKYIRKFYNIKIYKIGGKIYQILCNKYARIIPGWE